MILSLASSGSFRKTIKGNYRLSMGIVEQMAVMLSYKVHQRLQLQLMQQRGWL